MRWPGAIVVLLFLCRAAAAQDVIVRSSLDPASGAVVGQPVRLLVDVLFPGAMPRPPRVQIGDVAGAQVIRFETQAVTMRDQIGDQSYVGQRFEFVVFPRRGGTIDIPAPEVTLIDSSGDPTGSVKGQPQSIAVTVPPGIDASGPVLAAAEATARESWLPDRMNLALKPGDAVKRTIERKAAGVPALGMADFQFTAPEGVRVYVDPPRVDDRMNRGEVTGSRTDQVTYVFEKPGTYVLPPLDQPWWDLGGKQARNISLPGISVTVAAPSTGLATRSGDGRRWLAAILMAGFLILLGLIALRRRRLHAAADRNSESVARNGLIRVAKTGNAAETYRALTDWLDHFPPSSREALDQNAELLATSEELRRALFGKNGKWSRQSGIALARAVAAASLPIPGKDRPVALPPLNPVAP